MPRSWFRSGRPETNRPAEAPPVASPAAVMAPARVSVNGTCRVERVEATVAPRYSLWQPADEPGCWRVGRWFLAGNRPRLHCRYDLRGLPFGGRCPECGKPTADSARLHLGLARGRSPAEVAANQDRAARLRRAAAAAGYEPDAVRVTRNAISFGTLTLRQLGVTRELRAADVVRSLAEFAALHFGTADEATLALASLRLTRSEGVGSIVFALVDHGLLTASADDRRDDFDGLFTLDGLFDGWADVDRLPTRSDAPPAGRSTPPSDDASTVLQHDAACGGCRYNLRGLPVSGRCPECGRPVAAGLASDPGDRDRLARLRWAASYAAVVRDCGRPLDAVLLVADVLRTVRPPPGPLGMLGFSPRPVAAAEVVAAFRSFCGRYFNDADEARDLLTEWHLSTGEDLGRVVAALAAAGLFTAGLAGAPSDFVGLYTVDTLFA